MIKVLSIDGGGIRGLVPARILEYIENRTGKPTHKLFDVIVGSSTGGIIALGLAKERPGTDGIAFSAGELAQLYEVRGRDIFSPRLLRRLPLVRKAPYPAKGLEQVLEEYFGEALLSDCLTRVAVTAYDMKSRQPVVFSSAKAREVSNLGTRLDDYFVRDVARATSAAPTYFPPARVYPVAFKGQAGHEKVLIDGGVFANNPSLAGIGEAVQLFNASDWNHVYVVSLGTGTQTVPFLFHEVRGWGLVDWAKRFVSVVFDAVSDHTDLQLRSLMGKESPIGTYHRLQASLDSATRKMDDASPENIQRLNGLASHVLSECEQQLDDIIGFLTR